MFKLSSSSLIPLRYQFAEASLHILMFNLSFGILPFRLPPRLCFPVSCRLSAQTSDQGAITVLSSFSCCIFQHQEDRLHKRCLKSLDIAAYHCIPWTHPLPFQLDSFLPGVSFPLISSASLPVPAVLPPHPTTHVSSLPRCSL